MTADMQMSEGDPTQRTIDTLHREITAVQEWAELQLRSAKDVSAERLRSIDRENEIREAHRLELKADNERTVTTAMIAAEKAVQAALAAAEKARDQQTIASQLATEKAEKAGKEQLEQQSTTFGTAISSLNSGLGDVKNMLGELRAEKRGSREVTTEHRAINTQTAMVASVIATLFGGVFGAMLFKAFGG